MDRVTSRPFQLPFLSRLYDWVMRLAASRRAVPALFGVSFLESSVFPIPPDVMLIPMCLARRDRAFHLAALCTLASILGGLAGYAIGALLYESIGAAIIDFYGYHSAFADFQRRFTEWGGWIVAGAGFTPFPFKVITITSGVVHLDLAVFLAASVAARGARFFLVAALLWKFGPPVRGFIERNLAMLTLLFFALFVGGFALVRYIF